MKKWILTLAVLVAFFGQSAQAAFLLEPYAGTLLSAKVGDSDLAGTGMGARIGIQNMGLMFGLDYQMISGTLDTTGDPSVSLSAYGLFVGYDFPIMLRVWASFILNGSSEADLGLAGKMEYTKMSGTKFGLGYKILPLISLNIESGSLELKEGELAGVAQEDSTASYMLLSISFPLTI